MRKEIWEIAIGLNKVDNLMPSDYLPHLRGRRDRAGRRAQTPQL